MAEHNINVNVNENGKSATRNPDNISSKKTKVTRAQAKKEMAELKSKQRGQVQQDLDKPTTKPSSSGSLAKKGMIAVGGGLAVANFVADYATTGASLRGADHKAEKIGQTMKQVNATASILGAFAIGGPLVGAIAIGWQAYNLSQENRKFLKEIQVDNANVNYYTQRVTYNSSERR